MTKDKGSIEEFIDDFISNYPDLFKPKYTKLDVSCVDTDNINDKEPILQFVDKDNVVENICNVKGIDDGMEKVGMILDNSEYEYHYLRVFNKEDTWFIDYGSHTTEFRVKEGK